MGELRAAHDITDRVYSAVCRAQGGIHLDALSTVLNASSLQAEIVNIGAPACGHQQMAGVYISLNCLALQDDAGAGPARLNAQDGNIFPKRHAFPAQPVQHDSSKLRVLA